MFTGTDFVTTLRSLGITHIVWLPDATTGAWEDELQDARDVLVIRVCREGEAWAVAAGLQLGGQRPFIVIQNTGLFESGDAMRNVLFDLQIPLYAVIGYRNALTPNSTDTARRFTEPILRAWELDYVLLRGEMPLRQLAEHFRACRAQRRAGIALLPEGR